MKKIFRPKSTRQKRVSTLKKSTLTRPPENLKVIFYFFNVACETFL